MKAQHENKSMIDDSLKQKSEIPSSVLRIIQRAKSETFTLDLAFQNLEDPLKFIQNEKIQQLRKQALQTSEQLKKEKDEITQFSKINYKKIISRENNEYNFENIRQSKLPRDLDLEISKTRGMKNLQQILSSHKEHDQKKTPELYRQYKHKLQDTQEVNLELDKSDLKYSHIKLLDTPEFQRKCKHVEFYEMLQPRKVENHMMANQSFDIASNAQIEKAFSKLKFQLIENSPEYGSISERLFYDFESNLHFWKHGRSNGMNALGQYVKADKTDEEILSLCANFDRNHPSMTNLCDFAMRKITCDMASRYFEIKKNHEHKAELDKRNQNLDDKYNQLRKDIEHEREMRLKTKAQRIPMKYVETESQTIHRMEEKDFDQYFKEDTKQMIEELAKFNAMREKAMTVNVNDLKSKVVMIVNINAQIKEILFQLLLLMLKGEKLYQDEAKTLPLFTYSDLIQVESRADVETRILELVYTSFDKFEVEEVDGVKKSLIIQIYLNEREKNHKIQQIIHSQE